MLGIIERKVENIREILLSLFVSFFLEEHTKKITVKRFLKRSYMMYKEIYIDT